MSLEGEAEAALRVLGGDVGLVSEETLREQRDSYPDRVAQRTHLRRREISPAAFDYQSELAAAMAAIAGQGKRGLVSLPTGAGKTRTALLAFISAVESEESTRWLWMAPSVELVEQASQTLAAIWLQSPSTPDIEIATRGSSGEGASIWFNTPQAMLKRDRGVDGFTAIVFDEAHQLGAPTFRAAVERWSRPGTAVVGLSATPGRNSVDETHKLVDYFQGRLLRAASLGGNPVETLQKRGVLSRLSFRSIGSGASEADQSERLKRTAQLCVQLSERGRTTMVFTRTVGEAIALALHLRSVGIAADYVEGRVSEGERRARLADFAAGRTRVLFNQRLLATGYDCPAITDVVLGSRIGSPLLFEQMVGRGARGPQTGGSTVARIWEFDDHRAIHGLPVSYYRYRDFDWGAR